MTLSAPDHLRHRQFVLGLLGYYLQLPPTNRAPLEGLTKLPRTEMARRTLGIEHGAEVEGAHRLVVAQVAAIARRRRDPRWRLAGLAIEDTPAAQLGPPTVEVHKWH